MSESTPGWDGSIAGLEEAYQDAMRGPDGGPDAGVLYCPVCRRSFVLFRGDPDNEICEHWTERIDKHTAYSSSGSPSAEYSH